MNPTVAQMLVEAHQHDLQVEAANVRLAAEARRATDEDPVVTSTSPSPLAAIRRLFAGVVRRRHATAH